MDLLTHQSPGVYRWRGQFIPASQAADEGGDVVTRMGQTLHRDVLPVVPGVPTQLKSQSRAAMRTVPDMALDAADPGAAGSVQPGATPAESMQALKDAFNHEYESTVGQYSLSVPKDLTDMVEARIKAAQPNVDDTTQDKVSRAVAARWSVLATACLRLTAFSASHSAL